jgi:large subunit ribosomal protein L9
VPEVVLLKDVESLGERGSVVEVSKGYLRNFLIPRKLASVATPGALEAFRRRQEAEERARREALERAEQNAAMLSRTVLTIPAQAGTDGRLFGSVGAKDIVEAIRAARQLKLDRRAVHLPEPIKSVGTYMVDVELPAGHRASVKTIVVAAQDKRAEH